MREAYNLQVGRGLAFGSDAFTVGVEATKKAVHALPAEDLSVVLVFSSVAYDPEKLLKGVHEVVGETPVIGCSTAGEILDGPHAKSVAVVALASPFLKVNVGMGKNVSRDWSAAVREAVESPDIYHYFSPENPKIWKELESNGKTAFAMMFSPGNTKYADSKSLEILESLKKLSSNMLPIIGASCADDWRMEENYIFFGKHAHPDSLLLAVFETQVRVGMSIKHGFVPTKVRATVSKAREHELLELDGRPAAEVYAHLAGLSLDELKDQHLTFTTGKALGLPLSMGQYNIIVASYVTEDNGIRMSQPVDEGASLVVMDAVEEQMALAGQDALRNAILRGGIDDPTLILVFSCALRPRVIEGIENREISQIKNEFPQVPVVGFYSFGEQGLGDDGVNRHCNFAVSTLVLSNELTTAAHVSREYKALIQKLENTIEEKQKAHEKIAYLNSLLQAISNINQLIVREKNKRYMLRKCLEYLLGTKGYVGGWVTLFDKQGNFESHVKVGIKQDDFFYIKGSLDRAEKPYCIDLALENPGVNTIKDPLTKCPTCSIAKKALCDLAISTRLEYGGRIHGIMTLLRGVIFDDEKREHDLIKEVSDDIGLALNNMELEKEKQQIEEDLRKSEERYRLLVEESFDGIFIQKGTHIVFANKRLHEMLGYRDGELIGLDHWIIYHPEYHDITRQRAQERLAGRYAEPNYEVKLQRKDRSWFYGEINAKGFNVEGEPGIQVWVKDIHDKKCAEENIIEEKEKFRVLVDFAPFGVALIDSGGEYQYINPKFKEMFGYELEEIKSGKEWFQKAYPNDEDRRGAIEAWKTDFKDAIGEKASLRTFKVNCKDGSKKLISFNTVLLPNGKYLIMCEDITEKEKVEKQLRQAQRLEAMGILAGGIAHDFNNILAAIMGYTELASLEAPPDSPTTRNLRQVIEASQRAKSLIKQILSFSRQGEQEKAPVNIVSIFKESLKLLRASIPTTIDIKVEIQSDLSSSTVFADATQMHQVLMNLCTNAAHAMREKGGVLGVKIREVHLGEDRAEISHFNLSPGPYLRLSVSDTGHGMSPDIIERIFEPYFTTKEKGEGTGLGLAMVHGIVRDHKGAINVYSEVGKGTVFHVYLPLLKHEQKKEVEKPADDLPRGSENILFVDDEPSIVEVGEQMLKFLGYKVTATTSAKEALELFKKEPYKFDLIVTDMTMPHMTGDQLAKHVLQIRPSIPVIICTGFSERINPERAKEMGVRTFAMKPLALKDFAKIIRKVLEEEPK